LSSALTQPPTRAPTHPTAHLTPQDPHRTEAYLAHNPFLPDINNELPAKNKQYAANLAALDKMVLVKFAYDSMGEGACSAAARCMWLRHLHTALLCERRQ
jgi:hypothetical protein